VPPAKPLATHGHSGFGALVTKFKVKSHSEKLYYSLQRAGIDVLYDDRDESPGVKSEDADLIGIPIRLVVSERTLNEHSVEMKMRDEKKIRLIKQNKIIPEILKIT